MNEGAPMMYHGNAYGGPGPVFMVAGGGGGGGARQYPLELLQFMGGLSREAPPPLGSGTPHRERQPSAKGDTAFGYESDDSSLSSNASGSNKSSEKGDSASVRSGQSVPELSASTYTQAPAQAQAAREWRPRVRRDRDREREREREHPRPRRIAPERYLNATYPFQVKFTPDDLLNGSKWDTLSQEIWDKFIKSQQTEETFRKKMNLWRYLYITIKTIFPRYGLYVVGSTMSGFGLDSSDMDLCLHVRAPPHTEHRAHALLHLGFILNYIRSFDPGAELIQAKVPILKFGDARHGLTVDLNCNNVVGIRNTNLLYCYSRLDWRVRPLVVATKLWAAAHNINDARQRTLSSYSLTLMVIHFLQCGVSPAVLPCVSVRGGWDGFARPPPAPRSASRHSLGELFTLLLRYYTHFPYDKMAVSVRAGQPVPVAECRAARSHKNDPHQWKLLCVEEPFDLTNTARSVYDPETFTRIVETFRASYRRLSAGLRLGDSWPAPTHWQTPPPPPADR